jgi:hypothetical protein
MSRIVLIALLALSIVAPSAAAGEVYYTEDNHLTIPGPYCWRIDLSQVPPIVVWACDDFPTLP